MPARFIGVFPAFAQSLRNYLNGIHWSTLLRICQDSWSLDLQQRRTLQCGRHHLKFLLLLLDSSMRCTANNHSNSHHGVLGGRWERCRMVRCGICDITIILDLHHIRDYLH